MKKILFFTALSVPHLIYGNAQADEDVCGRLLNYGMYDVEIIEHARNIANNMDKKSSEEVYKEKTKDTGGSVSGSGGGYKGKADAHQNEKSIEDSKYSDAESSSRLC